MTFIWTEISFLSMWWEYAHTIRKKNLKKLIDEGRFEILTGGWVMTDEANVDLFAMVDQLVEGIICYGFQYYQGLLCLHGKAVECQKNVTSGTCL